MSIPHLFNKHSLPLIIYGNTSEKKTSKHSAVDSTQVRKPLLQETALRLQNLCWDRDSSLI